MSVVVAFEEALTVRLGAASALAGVDIDGIHRNIAPQGKRPPYIIFQQQAFIDRYTHASAVHGRRSSYEATYLIKAVTKGYDDTSANKLDSAIDGLVTFEFTAMSGYRIGFPHRVGGFSTTETRDGVVYQHCGGSYKFTLSPFQT